MQRPAEDRGDASRAPEEDPEQHSGHEAADEPDAPGSGLTAGDSALERTEGTCQPGSVCGAARLPDSPFPRRSSASDARLGQAGPGRPAPDRRHPCREGARLFVPCPGAARQRRSLHIEDGLWDGDGTSRFPPCLGAHRFEELFCFLDFFSPCSPRPESSPSPRPRGHRLLTPSAESVRRVRSLPRPRTPHGGSRGEAEPPRRGDDARDGAARPQTITSLLPPLAAPPHEGLHWNVSEGKASLPFFLALHARTRTP